MTHDTKTDLPEVIYAHAGPTNRAGGWRAHKLYMTEQVEYRRSDARPDYKRLRELMDKVARDMENMPGSLVQTVELGGPDGCREAALKDMPLMSVRLLTEELASLQWKGAFDWLFKYQDTIRALLRAPVQGEIASLRTHLFEWPGMDPDTFNQVMPAIEEYFNMKDENK